MCPAVSFCPFPRFFPVDFWCQGVAKSPSSFSPSLKVVNFSERRRLRSFTHTRVSVLVLVVELVGVEEVLSFTSLFPLLAYLSFCFFSLHRCSWGLVFLS